MINKILIVDNDLYQKRVKENNLNNPAMIFNIKEAEDLLLQNYDHSAVFYLCEKYGYSYDLAVLFLNIIVNFKSDDALNESSVKIRELYHLKQDLIDQGLLNYSYKKELFFNSEVILEGYEFNFVKLVEILKNNRISFKANYKGFETKPCCIYSFKSLVEELVEGFNRLCEKLEVLKSYEDVYIVAPQSIHSLICFYAFQFNINIKSERVKLVDFPFYESFVDDFINNNGLLEVDEKDEKRLYLYECLKKYFDLSRPFNKTKEVLKDYLYDCLKNEYIDEKDDGIVLLDKLPQSAQYVLVFDFSEELLSSIKDADYLSDEEKIKYSYSLPSFIANSINERKFKAFLSSYEDKLVLSSLDNKEFFDEYFIDSGSLNHLKNRYSKSADLILLNHYKKNRIKYKAINDLEYYLMQCDLGENTEYNSDMDFSISFSSSSYYSYSSLKSYIMCPFSFYLKNVLKLKEEKNDFSLILGNLLHQFAQDYILGKEIDSKIKYYDELSVEENYYLKRRVEDFLKNIDYLLFYRANGFKKSVEYPFTYVKDYKIIGRYDLLLEDENDYIIIDFKTGLEKFNYPSTKYGFNLQLPIYFIAAEKIYSDKKCLACLIQPLKPKVKGTGFTLNSSVTTVKLLQDGELANHFSTKKKNEEEDNFNLDEEKINTLRKRTTYHLNKAIEGIRKGEFKISPAKIMFKDNYNACKYCSFKDVCLLDRSTTSNERVYKDESV